MKPFTIFIGMFLLSIATAIGQQVNDKVEVEYNGAWYGATITKVKAAEGMYYITYDGWDSGWDEWVGPDRMRNYSKGVPIASPVGSKWKVGDRCMVEYGMIPEPATIIEVGEANYHIKYDKTVFGTKWVKEGQIKKL